MEDNSEFESNSDSESENCGIVMHVENEEDSESDNELIHVGEGSKPSSSIEQSLGNLHGRGNLKLDDLIKRSVSQGGTYLNLENVSFKDKLKTIDDWAQSLAIVISNHEETWDKKRFVDYVSATLQGDVLQWVK